MTVVPLAALPLGFRFHPTDEELVNHYLKRKINGRIRSDAEVIPEIDLCKCEPWDLPDKSLIRSEDPEWFFFSAKDRKYPNGHRSNRATEAGYWKATGKDRFIRSKAPAGPGIIGMKKTLVFHQGRAPKGVRTHWIMHEYRATEPEFETGDQGGYVLYRLFRKTEEKSSCSNGDEVERSSLSPAPTKSSPDDTTHEGDVLEELGTPIRATPDLQDKQPLSAIVEEQTAGITRWLADKGDRSSLKQENSHCNSHMALDVKSEDDAKAGGANVDPLLEALEQFCSPQNKPLDSIGFPNISSPMLPYNDHPFLGNNNQESYMGFDQAGYIEQDPMIDILNSILNNQDDCYSGSNVKQTSTAEAMHSRSSSELDTDFGPVQGAAGLETPGWCYADMPTYGFPEFDYGVQNSTLFPYNDFGPDVYSIDSGAESLHELFNIMDESTGHKNVSGNGADLQKTEIERRPPNQLPNVGHFANKQGNAKRRLILSVTGYSISRTKCESDSDEENYEDREAAEEVGKDEDSSIENELSSVKEEEKEAKKVRANEDYGHIAKERDISECMLPCKHKNLPICDDAISLVKPDEVSHSEIFQEAKPTASIDEDETSHSETSKQSESLLRLRTKSTNETIRSERLKITALKIPNVTVAYINRVMVLLVILLLICVGIWSWGRSRTLWIAGASVRLLVGIYSNQQERGLE